MGQTERNLVYYNKIVLVTDKHFHHLKKMLCPVFTRVDAQGEC